MLKPGLTVMILRDDDPGNGVAFLSQLLADQTDVGYSFGDDDKRVVVMTHHQCRDIHASEIETLLHIYPKVCLLFVTTDHLIRRCPRCMDIARVIVELNSNDPTGIRVIKQ
jgi:hypothetical protein